MGWCQAVTGQERSTWQMGLREADVWMKEVSLISEKGRKVGNPWCHRHLTEYKHMVKRRYIFSHEWIHRLHIYLKACTAIFQNKMNNPPAFHFCMTWMTKAGNISTSLSSARFQVPFLLVTVKTRKRLWSLLGAHAFPTSWLCSLLSSSLPSGEQQERCHTSRTAEKRIITAVS